MNDINRKRGMRLIILDILRLEKLHGYGISEKIEELYGIKKPSSGIIYPALSYLRRLNLIKLCEEGKRDKKIYKITEKGMNYLKEHRSEVERIKKTLKNLGEFNRLGGDEMIYSLHLTLKNINKLNDEEKRRLSKILYRTSRELRKLLEEKNYE